MLAPTLSNIKIWIPEIEAGATPLELYAKVVEGASAAGAAGFTIRFTSMAPEVGEVLRTVLH